MYDENGHEIGLRFLVISDWGGVSTAPYKTDAQMKVAQGMADLAERYDSSFILSLGDNFRDKGVVDINDPRFEVKLPIDVAMKLNILHFYFPLKTTFLLLNCMRRQGEKNDLKKTRANSYTLVTKLVDINYIVIN